MTDLDQLIGRYVNITDPEGEGVSGWMVSVSGKQERDGVEFRTVMLDYGYGWDITPDVKIEEAPPPRMLEEPHIEGSPEDPSSTIHYGGIPKLRGVSLSSRVAHMDRATFSVDDSQLFVDMEAAIYLQGALGQFIERAKEHHPARVEAAYHRVYGTIPEEIQRLRKLTGRHSPHMSCLVCGEGLDDENISDYCSDTCDPTAEATGGAW